MGLCQERPPVTGLSLRPASGWLAVSPGDPGCTPVFWIQPWKHRITVKMLCVANGEHNRPAMWHLQLWGLANRLAHSQYSLLNRGLAALSPGVW